MTTFHDDWLSSSVKTFQAGLGANDADDAILAWWLDLAKNPGAMVFETLQRTP